jgi:hypothetical protein
MRTILKLAAVLAFVLAAASTPTATRLVPVAVAPTFASIGPLAFAPSGVLFAADRQAATVFALTLGGQAASTTPGTASVPQLDQRIAGLLGTAADQITITDLAVHPTSKNSFVSVMRGQGAGAQPALLRIDGTGKVDLIAMDAVQFTSVALPNPAAVSTSGRGGRTQSVTDMSLIDGRLFVAGLSNEEFASKLWSVPYPFTTADRGASVEIYHGNHGAWETRAPVMTFLPYEIGSTPLIVAAYTCTPLVKFEMNALKAGEKVVGHTMLELGAGNQPIDMIAYAKGGQNYLLLANSRHGILKVPTAQFASTPAITARVAGTAGAFEPVSTMTGVEQLDLLDAERAVTIARGQDGSRSLTAAALP